MRKNILKRALCWLLMLVMLVGILPTVVWAEGAEDAQYLTNQGSLSETAFLQLPVGAVKAEGWLENQMLLMKQNITGLMKEHTNYNADTSAWLGAAGGEGWEKGPYYARGVVAMAYILEDEELLEEGLKWVAAIIDSQGEDGLFGPDGADMWSRMPALNVVRDFYEGAENKAPDHRTAKEQEYMDKVIPFFEAYFRYELANLPSGDFESWTYNRMADNIEIIYWLYNRCYDAAAPAETEWLMDLTDQLIARSQTWDTLAATSTVRAHVVNTTQALKYSPIVYQKEQKQSLREGFAKMIDNVGLDHGRVDDLPNADEGAATNEPWRGTELCAVTEGIISAGIAMEVYGEGWIGDWLETIAYNSLPAAFPSDYSSQSYFVQQNQPITTQGIHEFYNDYGCRTAYSAPAGFECCFPNCHSAWPKFVQNMWMATEDGGLALVAYGPNNVTAKVAGGKTAVFKQTTDYPFKNVVRLDYTGETAEFALRLRVPEWAKGVTVTVDGVTYTDIASGEFYTVDRNWNCGDSITIEFEAEIELSRWYNNSTAVQYGALIYSLQIKEDWRKYTGADIGAAKPTEEQPDWEVYPASPWNYGLVTDENAVFDVVEKEVGLAPFSNSNAPTLIQAKGVLLEDWILNANNAANPPYGPIRYEEAEVEDITLIPYGCTNIRITQFPTMNNSEATDKVVRTDSCVIKRSGVTYQEFDNVVVSAADQYNLKITAEGSGTVTINSNYSQAVSGNTTIENLGNLSGLTGGFYFGAEQFNNIRFTGDIQVSQIEIEMVQREHTSVRIISSKRKGNTASILTNLDPSETPYELRYGTESGKYTQTALGFDSGQATLRGLDAQATYYIIASATVGGERESSEEYVLQPAAESDGLTLNSGAIRAQYDGFADAADIQTNWKIVDPDGAASIKAENNGTALSFASSKDIKAMLNVSDCKYWTDYAVEADITLDGDVNNNAGIIVRCSEYAAGANSFKGYYVGISKTGVHLIYGTGNGWGSLDTINRTLNLHQKYNLRVVVYDNMLAVYLDGELIRIMEDTMYAAGTVGLRSYMVPFTVSDFNVEPLTAEDLVDLQKYIDDKNGDNPIVVRHEMNKASFAGLGSSKAETEALFTFYDPSSLIKANADGSLYVGKGTQVKAALKVSNPDEWVDYVVEADIAFSEATGTNAGIMFRVDPDTIGTGPNALNGYYVGIKNTGVEVGYFQQSWKKITTVERSLKANQVYKLKVVVYDNMFAAYVDGNLVYQYVDDAKLFNSGTVGVRSYNQAFTTSALTVRGVKASDLIVFGGALAMEDDLTDANTDSRWKSYGDTASINFRNGRLEFGKSTNVKAVTGDAEWSNYVVEADITLGASDQPHRNAGIMWYVSDPRSGSDAYNGYYFGIAPGHYYVSRAKHNNTPIRNNVPHSFCEGTHTLTVVAQNNKFLCYVDGELITSFSDNAYSAGQIGFRSYNRAFSADNVKIRQMTAREKADLAAFIPEPENITISAVTAEKAVQVKYPKVASATSTRIVYGTQSGNYTNSIEDLPHYPGVNKLAFSVPENGTYYAKLYMLDGDTLVAQSNEITVTTGYVEDVTAEKNGMLNTLAAAKTMDTSSFTADSLARLNAAIAEAEAVALADTAHQMDYRLAKEMLMVAMDRPDSSYPAGGHSWEADYTVDTEATCGAAGSKSIHCENCDTQKQDSITSIPATGEHVAGELIVDTAATCTAKGVGHKNCTVCGQLAEGNIEIAVDPTKHSGNTFVHDAKDATCTATGYTGDVICECGVKLQSGEAVAMKKHIAGEWKVVKEATTKAEGLKEQRCTVCNTLLKSETIAKKKEEAPKVNFTDVKKNDFFYTPVQWAVANGVTTGTSKTTFGPNESCTRAQAVTFLWRAAGQPAPKSSKNPFTDVKKSDYYYKAVLWAAENGVTSGTSKTKFSPNDVCTRGQIVTFLWRAQGQKKVTASNPFKDVKKSDFYYNAVLWAVKNNVTSGTSKTTFEPDANCTRGQIVTFLYRAIVK